MRTHLYRSTKLRVLSCALIAPVTAAVILSASAAGTAAAGTAGAKAVVGPPHMVSTSSGGGAVAAASITVAGSPLTNITSSPLQMTPAFVAADTDYVWYCRAGLNQIVLSLASSGTISTNGVSGRQLSVPISVVNNQAVVVTGPDGTQYWIRCLPVGFPRTTAVVSGAVTPGYFIGETFGTTKSPGYPLIFNSYGTPVWYLVGVPRTPQDTELIPGTHTLVWDDNPSYTMYNIDSQSVTSTQAPIAGFDEHERFYDPNGNVWVLSRPIVPSVDLGPIGFPSVDHVEDCIVQEVNPFGQLIWQWDASQHVSPLEANSLVGKVVVNNVVAVDAYHCNSIDVNPLEPTSILLSMRTSGVYLIDKATSNIKWKLGGTAVPPLGGEPVLRIVGDPEGKIFGQHDARFQPNGAITLFDDHSKTAGASRAIEYSIHTMNDTAKMDWEYAAPSGRNSLSMGSVRVYDANGLPYDEDGSGFLAPEQYVINWGHGSPNGGFTVLNSSRQVSMNVQYPVDKKGYRTTFVPMSSLDLTALRNTAGTTLP